MKSLPLSAPLALALAFAFALTGCIQNMADLKDRVGGDDAPAATDEPIETASTTTDTTTNTTPSIVQRPPVARVSIFAEGGALVYKSTFQADDPAEVVFVPAKSKLNLIASDSESLEPGATLSGFAWTLNGKAIEGGRQASVEIGEPGLYAIGLVVTDSNGKTDGQSVKLGVAPEPYDVVTELTTGPVVGAEGEGAPADVAWELAAPEKPATVTAVTIVAAAPIPCDAILELIDAEGTSVGSADNAGHTGLDQTETLSFATLAYGAYTIRVAPFACVADAVPITVTVTYLPIVEGLGAGDGHGHAH